MANPSKTQFYKTVYKILNKKKYKKVLDIGCGHFDLYKNIIVEEYYGIDVINYNLEIQQQKNVFYEQIDFNKFQTKHKFDLIVIHNTVNITGHYDINNFENNLNKINFLLNDGGYLSINFGHRDKNFYEKINHIILHEHKKFGYSLVNSFKYGFLHYHYSHYMHKILNRLIALFPILDRNHLGQKFKYFLLKKI